MSPSTAAVLTPGIPADVHFRPSTSVTNTPPASATALENSPNPAKPTRPNLHVLDDMIDPSSGSLPYHPVGRLGKPPAAPACARFLAPWPPHAGRTQPSASSTAPSDWSRCAGSTPSATPTSPRPWGSRRPA